MLKPLSQKAKLFSIPEDEMLEKLVSSDHAFRKLNELLDFAELVSPYRSLYSNIGAEGIDILKGFKALLIQFWEDYSDREMEKALRENVAVKWFCGFKLLEDTPDHSYFGKLRKRLGADNLADIFNNVNQELQNKGLFGDVFKFIDASSIITKTQLWDERDKAIAAGEEKLNNQVVNNYTADKEAKWGAKSKNNIWFGYKRHCRVDMRHGLIDESIVTPANVLDFQIIKRICPRNCMAFMDKLYDTKDTHLELERSNCHSGIIKKNSNKAKNRDLDSWISKVRMPFEGTFSKLGKKARYRGLKKVSLQCTLESICYNLKKAIKILDIPIPAEA